MDIIEGNKLIMFFDGAEDATISVLGKPTPCIKYKDSYYPEWNLPPFQEDWRLLMPAIKKFKSLDLYDFEYAMRCNDINTAVETCEIIPAWEALVEAIIWYNNNKK